MSTLAVRLVDPTSTFTPSSSGSEGALVDDLRDNCGFVIQGVDWVCRKIGFDLIAAIFEPIAGDFDAVDAMASNWAALGAGLGQIGQNYATLGGAAPQVWTGYASTSCIGKLGEFADGFDTQAEGAALISTAMQDMLVATKAVVELVAEVLSLVDEAVMALISSWLKLARELATGGATVRRIVSLVNEAINAIQTLSKVIPPLLQAVALMSSMFKGLSVAFTLGSISTNTNSGTKVDDLAEAGF